MTTIYVLLTVVMGTQTPLTVHATKSACEFAVTAQKQLGVMDTSNMRCVKYTRSD